MRPRQVILREIKKLESKAAPVEMLRDHCLTDGGRFNDAGKGLIAWAKRNKVKQADVARLFDVSPSAICRHYH